MRKELSKNKQIIQKAKNKGYIKANTTWTERFQELTDVSNTLYKNLEYENARKLNKDKFHRYTSLHFRSVILGNLAYKDYWKEKSTSYGSRKKRTVRCKGYMCENNKVFI